jgi:hypothetical protein
MSIKLAQIILEEMGLFKPNEEIIPYYKGGKRKYRKHFPGYEIYTWRTLSDIDNQQIQSIMEGALHVIGALGADPQVLYNRENGNIWVFDWNKRKHSSANWDPLLVMIIIQMTNNSEKVINYVRHLRNDDINDVTLYLRRLFGNERDKSVIFGYIGTAK